MEAHEPCSRLAVRGASPTLARSSPRGGSTPSAWLSGFACWVKVAAKADKRRGTGQERSSDQVGPETNRASRALARARARTKEAASSLHRPPTSTAKTTNRQRSERSSSGCVLSLRSRTREIPTWCPRQAAARPTTALRWQLPQAAACRPGSSLPSGCCTSPSLRPRGTLAQRAAQWSPRESKGR